MLVNMMMNKVNNKGKAFMYNHQDLSAGVKVIFENIIDCDSDEDVCGFIYTFNFFKLQIFFLEKNKFSLSFKKSIKIF